MMTLLIASILSVSGCASAPSAPPPDWGSVDRIENSAVDLTPLPVLCEIPDWDLDCWSVFEQYEEISFANYALGSKNTSALRKTEGAHNHLANAGQMQQELTDFYAELLKEEKLEHTIDNLTFRVIIGLGLIGAFL